MTHTGIIPILDKFSYSTILILTPGLKFTKLSKVQSGQ